MMEWVGDCIMSCSITLELKGEGWDWYSHLMRAGKNLNQLWQKENVRWKIHLSFMNKSSIHIFAVWYV